MKTETRYEATEHEEEKKAGSAASGITYWLCMLAVGAFAVLYFTLGWQEVVYELSMYLDGIFKSIFTLCGCTAAQKIAEFLIIRMRSGTKRSQTVASMLASIVKYGLAILTIVLCVTFFIEDPTELFSSLGILALVVGLGCESLIADVVAGIFLVIEGEFEVGDIIVYEDWRGTVKEIGLRTTKIEDISGSVKIINNSNITEITNKSKSLSLAVCRYGIDGEVAPEQPESALNDHAQEIRTQIPAIVDGPFYKGIEELGAGSYTILVTARCREEDKFQTQRDLNLAVKQIFDEAEIAFADGEEEE